MAKDKNKATFLYNQRYNDQLLRVIQPLKFLGINNFCYAKFYKNGEYIMLHNNLEVMRDFLLNVSAPRIWVQEKLYFSNTNDTVYSIVLWPNEPEGYDMELCLKHNIWHGLNIVQSNEHSTELWSFAAIKENTCIQNFYRRHHRILFNYVDYFSKEMQNILAEGDKHLNFSNKDFGFQPHDHKQEFEREQQNIQAFLKHISSKGIKVNSKNGITKLTPAEIGCLQLLAKNNSAKEIARKLDISNRTVEKHIDNIKGKTGYSLRSDITNLFYDQVEKRIILLT